MRLLKLTFSTLFIFLINFNSHAQFDEERFQELEIRLEEYAKKNNKINKQVDISITGTLQEFAIAFSKETKINLTIDPSIDKKVVTNFSETKPKDILLHLCKFYDLDLTFSGSIISLIPYDTPKKKIAPKSINIRYNGYNDKLELNLDKDTLDYVVKEISKLTGKNIIASKEASMEQVSGYIGITDFEDALELFSIRNELELTKDDKGFYFLDKIKKEPVIAGTDSNTKNNKRKKRGNNKQQNNNTNSSNNFSLKSKTDSLGQTLLTLDAQNIPLATLIKDVSKEANKNYFLFKEPQDPVTLQVQNVTYQQFLEKAFAGSNFTFTEDKNIFLFGENTINGLRESKVVQLQHRSVAGLVEFLPKEFIENIEVKEFAELNSLILNGSTADMEELEKFIIEIDKSVPVVTIELMIIDVKKTRETRAGFEAGLSSKPIDAGGKLFPAIDFVFSSNAINRLLGLLAGNGIINLGQVKPNFYATLQAVEDDGYVNIKSKPRLSTLNGVEANLSLGETRYYLQERTTLQGTDNPISLQDRRYESVNADFSIKILPMISGDENVTLTIEVNQSDFTGQIAVDAPPGQVNRTFNSTIRVLDQEMIVLGGIESKGIEDSGTGVPFLARIPVIKWLFSKRRRAKSNTKLLIFIRPTIIY